MVSALNSMGRAYDGLRVYDKAIESYKETISLADNDIDIGVKFEAYKFLIDLMIKIERINEAYEICKDFEAFLKIAETSPRIPAEAAGRLWFYYYLSSAEVCRKLGKYDLAEKHIAQAETYPLSKTTLGLFGLKDARFNLLLDQGKYSLAEKALDLIDKEYGEVATP